MKTTLWFLYCVCYCLIIFSTTAFAQSSGNHITMSICNCSQPSSNTIEFDLCITSDGAAASDLRLNSTQWGVNFNTGILQSADTVTASYVIGTSDFIPPLSGYGIPNNNYPDHIRIIEGAYGGGNTGATMTVGHIYRAGTFLLTSTAPWVNNSNPNFSLQA